MGRIIAKTDVNSFGRDLDSKAVINTDKTAYQDYKTRRSIMRKEAEKAKHQRMLDYRQKDIDLLKQIKDLLQSIARG